MTEEGGWGREGRGRRGRNEGEWRGERRREERKEGYVQNLKHATPTCHTHHVLSDDVLEVEHDPLPCHHAGLPPGWVGPGGSLHRCIHLRLCGTWYT